MADNRPEIILDGDASPFRRMMREAAEDMKRFGKDGETAFGKMTGPLSALQSKFIAVGAVLAGGKVFKDAVDETVKLTGEANRLSKALGISTTQAGALNIALGDIYSSADDFIGASQQLGRQLRTNEEDLNAMGLRTREANGEYRNMQDLMFDAIGLLNSYKEGTDRNLAAQTLFGRGAGEITTLLKLQNDTIAQATEKQRELGLVVGVQNVDAAKEYKASMNDVGDVMSALEKSVGDAVMPVLTELGNWFAAIGPAAVVVIKGAIGGLVSVFWGLKLSVDLVIDAFKLIWNVGDAAFTGLGRLVDLFNQGRFQEMPKVVGETGEAMAAAFRKGQEEMVADATATQEKLWNLFATPDATAPKSGKGRTYAAPAAKSSKSKSGGAEQSSLPQYEAELAALRNRYETENALRQFSKEQELEFWQSKQKLHEAASKDGLALAKRTATLETEIRRTAAKDQRELDAVGIEHHRSAALARVEADQQAANFARENGEINKAELLELEADFARRRFEIEYQAQLERIELAKSDPNQSPAARAQLNEQLLELERKYQLQRGQILQNKKKEDDGIGSVWEDSKNAFSRAATGILTGARTLRQGLAGIFQSIGQSFVENLVVAPLGKWIAGQAKMLAVKLGFMTQEKALEATAAASTVGIKTAETTAVVAADAAQAGAGAAASQAAIPIVGPALALAAMAAVFGAVMAMGSKKSASKGYDIPKGLNPLTQLHEEEMVLPAQYANVIRGLSAGQGGGEAGQGARGGDTYVIQANDAKSFADYLKKNAHTLGPGMRRALRNGQPTSISSALGKVY